MIRTFSAVLLAAVVGMPAHADRQLGELKFQKCELPVVGARPSDPLPAECTTLSVPENWDAPEGRQIELAVALIPARSSKAQPDPVVFLAGGPGQAAREAWRGVSGAFHEVLQDRHVLLLDQRGTGGSARMECKLPSLDDPMGAQPTPEQLTAMARECLTQIELKQDPRYYTTSDAARDLDRLRSAVGAPQLNLVGGSYGTRMAQIYYQRYPDKVRSMVLDGIAPNDLVLGSEHAINLESTLKAQFQRCVADPECQQTYGDPYATLKQLQMQLRTSPQRVSLADPLTHERRDVPLVEGALAAAVRMYAYQPESVVLLPRMLAEAAAGRPEALLAQALMVMDDLGEQIHHGMQLSVMCSEDADAMAARAEDADTLLGNGLIEMALAQCSVWPTAPKPAGFNTPSSGDVPSLLLSGEFDPVTPPRYGEQVLKGLSRARHLVAAGQGHIVMTRGCMPKLMTEFIRDLDPAALDVSCLDALSAPSFFLNASGAAP